MYSQSRADRSCALPAPVTFLGEDQDVSDVDTAVLAVGQSAELQHAVGQEAVHELAAHAQEVGRSGRRDFLVGAQNNEVLALRHPPEQLAHRGTELARRVDLGRQSGRACTRSNNRN